MDFNYYLENIDDYLSTLMADNHKWPERYYRLCHSLVLFESCIWNIFPSIM